jgi:hypothetical protein
MVLNTKKMEKNNIGTMHNYEIFSTNRKRVRVKQRALTMRDLSKIVLGPGLWILFGKKQSASYLSVLL